jgi:hypothetical protein
MNDNTQGPTGASSTTSAPPPQYNALLKLVAVRYKNQPLFEKMLEGVEWRPPWIPSDKLAIDFNHDDNRVLALCFVIDDLTYDHADGKRIATIGKQSFNFEGIDEVRAAEIIRAALEKMHAPPLQNITTANKWNSAFARFKGLARSVDSIFDETKAAIARGVDRLKHEPALARSCRPSRLLFNAFPYGARLTSAQIRFTMLVGRCMMRDYLALALRPSFGNPPLIPQLMYTLVDEEEGGGKSTFCCVFAGGEVGDVGGHPRFTDLITVAAIIGNSTHGQQQLAAYAAGRSVCEWADKNLGAMNETQASVIKAYVNSGTIRWRNTFGRSWLEVNRRSLDIVTTNNEAILTVHLGVRRLPIVDLKLWRTNRTAPASVIAQNRNTGLEWFAEHRDVVLALAYREGLWKGSLAPPPALLKMMYQKVEDYTRFENWQMILVRALSEFEQKVLNNPDEVIAVPYTELSSWAVKIVGSKAPTLNAMGRFLTSLGWAAINRYVKGTARATERMRALEGAAAKQLRQEQGIKDPVVTQVLRCVITSSGYSFFVAVKADDYDNRHNPKEEYPF